VTDNHILDASDYAKKRHTRHVTPGWFHHAGKSAGTDARCSAAQHSRKAKLIMTPNGNTRMGVSTF
ncbi:hypothetical protein COCCADRAFT_87064, partial [Bipolaris zeicola 26-R-13]